MAEVPFDATRRKMTTVHSAPAGGYLVVCKEAPEVVLPASPPSDRVFAQRLRTEAYRLARAGHRVLAVAEATAATRPTPAALERDLRPIGLVVLTDPPRPGARDVVRRFTDTGVRLVLVTGDHPATASAIADALGLPAADRMVTGAGAGSIRASFKPSDAAAIPQSPNYTPPSTATSKAGTNEPSSSAGPRPPTNSSPTADTNA